MPCVGSSLPELTAPWVGLQLPFPNISMYFFKNYNKGKEKKGTGWLKSILTHICACCLYCSAFPQHPQLHHRGTRPLIQKALISGPTQLKAALSSPFPLQKVVFQPFKGKVLSSSEWLCFIWLIPWTVSLIPNYCSLRAASTQGSLPLILERWQRPR